VNALVLSLRQSPLQRLDLAPLTPNQLAGKSDAEITALPLNTTRERVCVGDVFRLRKGDPEAIIFFNNWITRMEWEDWLEERHQYWFAGNDWKKLTQ